MRAILAMALLFLGACGTPAPVTGPPSAPGILVLEEPGGGYSIVQAVTGATVRTLPPGWLEVALSSGGDVAEAYLLSATAAGGTEIDEVVPARGFALTPVANDPRRSSAGILLDAPSLRSFVGRPSVLVVLFNNGEMAGYQHGSLIWSDRLTSASRVVDRIGNRLYTAEDGGWRPVALDTGARGPVASTCSPGPVAEVDGQLVLDCMGVLSVGSARVPDFAPRSFVLGPSTTLLLFNSGEIWRVGSRAARRIGAVSPPTSSPVLSPDGATLYVPTTAGVESFHVATGRVQTRRLPGIASFALSRDGNDFYVLAGGMIATYSTSGGNRRASFPVTGTRIRLVAGG